MNIQVVQNYEQLCKVASFIIASELFTTPKLNIGTATGSTATGVYAELVKLYEDGCLDFSKASLYNMDEFLGLDRSHAQSRYNFIKTELVDNINISIDNFHIPDGSAKDINAECVRYEKQIDRFGGIGMQLLGLGVNGHIGFNEPNDHFEQYTYLADLTETTRQSNKKYFDEIELVPKQAITIGIGSIMKSKKIVLVASGYHKAWAVKEMIQNKVTPKLPASVLQFHCNATIIIDEAAASML